MSDFTCSLPNTTPANAGRALPKVSLHHLVRAGASELLARRGGVLPPTVSILDVGFGDGDLLLHAFRWLKGRWPELSLEVAGYEVAEQTGRFAGHLERVGKRLRDELGSDLSREPRLLLVGEQEGIPFEDHSFDLVLSNQVIEHVRDLDLLFAEICRVLAPGGVAVHFFPTREIWLEPHVGLPWVHHCRDWASARAAIRALSRLGLGRFRGDGRQLDAFSDWWADFLVRFAHYRSGREILRIARRHNLRAVFEYDGYAYRDKLRRLLRRGPSPAFPYRASASWLSRPLLHAIGRRLASTTLVLSHLESPVDGES